MENERTPATIRFIRRNAPHWLVADHTYFVTIRLAGTVPHDVLRSLLSEREALLAARCTENEQINLQRKQFAQIERILDAHHDERDWLTKTPVAAAFFDALPWLEESERGWHIHAVTLMSTHAHIVMRNGIGRSGELLRDLGQFKRHTARSSNRALDRSGSFWAREDFDHWCRDESKVLGAVRYTANNPVAAGLCKSWRDWPWTRIEESWAAAAGL